jgi:hypothetical protein
VTFVWENPYSYGPDRPCTCNSPEFCQRDHGRAQMSIGWPTWMKSYTGQLASDEAFIEVVTHTDSYTVTSVVTTPTEVEVGRVTDASGNTTARIYERSETTSVKEQRKAVAIANGQLFIPGSSSAVYDAQAWTRRSDNIVGVIEELLSPVPPRAR